MDNIKVVLKDIVCGVIGWIDLAQDKDQWKAPVDTVMKHRVP
jgi:hypothetical protein